MHRKLQRSLWPALVCALLAAPSVAQVQPPESPGSIDWREANDAVGQFRRGHVDVLRWEQKNMPAPASQAARPATLALPTAADAVRLAWRARPELATAMASLATENLDHMAEGRWHELDPTLQRNIHGASAVLGVAADARKAWLQAVAARQANVHHREVLASAEAATELGRRMVKVGNWSRLQNARLELSLSSSRMAMQRARYAAVRAESELMQMLALAGMHAGADLPDRLPDVPPRPIESPDLQRQIAALFATLPRAESFRTKADLQLALEAYRTSHELAVGYRENVLKLREFIAEETVLHYNGMLKSVWDLLAETGNRSQAAIDTAAAQLDFWLAEADLQLVLQGGRPERFVSLGTGGGAQGAAGAPGH